MKVLMNLNRIKSVQLMPCCGNKAFNIPDRHRWTINLFFIDAPQSQGVMEVDSIEQAEQIALLYFLRGKEIHPSFYNPDDDTYYNESTFQTVAQKGNANFIVTGSHATCSMCRTLRQWEIA